MLQDYVTEILVTENFLVASISPVNVHNSIGPVTNKHMDDQKAERDSYFRDTPIWLPGETLNGKRTLGRLIDDAIHPRKDCDWKDRSSDAADNVRIILQRITNRLTDYPSFYWPSFDDILTRLQVDNSDVVEQLIIRGFPLRATALDSALEHGFPLSTLRLLFDAGYYLDTPGQFRAISIYLLSKQHKLLWLPLGVPNTVSFVMRQGAYIRIPEFLNVYGGRTLRTILHEELSFATNVIRTTLVQFIPVTNLSFIVISYLFAAGESKKRKNTFSDSAEEEES